MTLLGEIFANALRREQSEQLLNNQLRFEQLLSDLSGTFIALRADKIDDAINESLRAIGEFIDVDRVFIDQFSDDKSKFRVTHMWTAPGIPRDAFVFDVVLSEYVPWYTRTILSGQPVIFACPDELPKEAVPEHEYVNMTGIKSSAIVPLTIGQTVIGNLGFDMCRHERAWSQETLKRLSLASHIIANALKRKQIERQLKLSYEEVNELKERLQAENIYLQKEIARDYSENGILGRTEVITTVLRHVEQVAGTESTVLILGETGSGKELIAKAVHGLSPRAEKTLVMVNCAALPATLIEAELFGREKGAYTGALSKQVGRFELADRSTIFLDEISELPLELQPKLLRVLQEGKFERLGSSRTIGVDVRVIAATNQDLAKLVSDGRFREDLYYRLNVFPIVVPPLRERADDIPVLTWVFVEEFSRKMGKKIKSIPKRTIESLQSYTWPGNVRELRNVVERAMILSSDDVLHLDLPSHSSDAASLNQTLQQMERQYIEKILTRTGWRISGRQGAAERLGLKPTTLRSRMERLGIRRPE